MILRTRDGRRVETDSIHWGDRDGADLYIESAYYIDEPDDAKAEVPSEVLDQLAEDNIDRLMEAQAEHMVCAAEDWADSQEDL